jgi:hypothetical protein
VGGLAARVVERAGGSLDQVELGLEQARQAGDAALLAQAQDDALEHLGGQLRLVGGEQGLDGLLELAIASSDSAASSSRRARRNTRLGSLLSSSAMRSARSRRVSLSESS